MKAAVILQLACISITTSSCFAWIVDFNNPVVHTQYGSIRGKIDERKTKFNRRPICTFLSIPYARPPIGANRFLVSAKKSALIIHPSQQSDVYLLLTLLPTKTK